MNLRKHRPSGFRGKGDRAVLNLHKEMSRFLLRLKGQLNANLLNVSSEDLNTLSAALVEFAEDLYNNIGLWESLENYNLQQFGTPLPIVLAQGKHIIDEPFDPFRIKYFLWNFLPELSSLKQQHITPFDADLDKISLQVAEFFDENFLKIPRGSGITKFLNQPNKFISQIKKKLIWIATDAYLFRTHLVHYLEKEELKPLPAAIDDYACQVCTTWSGLGAINILALVLNLPEEEKKDIINWYKRDLAIFEVKELKGRTSQLLNQVNGRSCWVVEENTRATYKVGDLVMGSLYQYKNEWYWSGAKAAIPAMLSSKVDEILQEIKSQASYIYGDLENKLQERYSYMMEKMNGIDLHYFDDGRALKLFIKKLHEDPIAVEKEVLTHVDIPRNKNGVALFLSKDDTPKIFADYNDLSKALKKEGNHLDEVDKKSLRDLLMSKNVNPKFVKRLAQEYGTASIFQYYFGKKEVEHFALDYLLRKYKGQYFRERFFARSLLGG